MFLKASFEPAAGGCGYADRLADVPKGQVPVHASLADLASDRHPHSATAFRAAIHSP
jgi:hypothetical protein